MRGKSVTRPKLPTGILHFRERQGTGDLIMRVFMAFAIAIMATVALGGCFHHEQAVAMQPISHPPLK